MLLRRIARPMLAGWFVYDGIQAALKPAEHAQAARRGVELVTEQAGIEAPLSENQVTQIVRVHGAATALAGLCLAVGKAPRTAAFTLAALRVPLAIVDQPFTADDAARSERASRFVTDIGAIGAALIAGADLEGRPGLHWRLDQFRARRVRSGRAVASAAGEAVTDAAGRAGRRARRASERARRDAERALRQAARAARSVVPAGDDA